MTHGHTYPPNQNLGEEDLTNYMENQVHTSMDEGGGGGNGTLGGPLPYWTPLTSQTPRRWGGRAKEHPKPSPTQMHILQKYTVLGGGGG